MVESVDFIQRTGAMSYAQFPRMSLPHVTTYTEICQFQYNFWLLIILKYVKFALFYLNDVFPPAPG